MILNFLSFCIYFKCWDYILACCIWFMWCWGLNPASYMLGKHAVNWAPFPAPNCHHLYAIIFVCVYMCILSNELSCPLFSFSLGLLEILIWFWTYYVAPEAGQTRSCFPPYLKCMDYGLSLHVWFFCLFFELEVQITSSGSWETPSSPCLFRFFWCQSQNSHAERWYWHYQVPSNSLLLFLGSFRIV